MATNRTDLPTVEDESRPYWEAAADGRLLIKRCHACGAAHHYPRPFCPACWSEDVSWEQASGKGILYTYSTVFRNDLQPFATWGPYIAAVVELAEGPRLMTNLVDCNPDDAHVGMAVEVAYRPLTDELAAPVFRPS
jgi:uncharacterized protein